MEEVMLLTVYLLGVTGMAITGILIVDNWPGRLLWQLFAILWPLWVLLLAGEHLREQYAIRRRR